MSDVDKRAFVADLYPSERWKKKVAAMPDSQVIAIYFREQEKQTTKLNPPKESGDDIPF